MTTLMQISDPHFGTERDEVVAALEDLIASLAPDVLLMTGDITQRATRRQFEAAAAFWQRQPVSSKLAIPGNHDIPLFDLWTRCTAPYRRYQRAFGAQLEPSLERKDCLIIALNTTRWWRHKHGEMSAAQIERVAARVARAPSSVLRIVATHQPLAVTGEIDRRNLLRGHQRALRCWREAGVDLVLGGHIHLPFALASGGSRTMWVVQAGTAVSARVRGKVPNSINVIRYAGANCAQRSCELERWDYRDGPRAFDLAHRQPLALGH